MSSLISGFEYDIFISYRQKDNKYDGWVTEFVSNLKNELESAFKEEVSVYFDENPHDGLLETHDVNDSLKEKLKCLIFIPIISRTYCDPKSFAWEHELKAFLKVASGDSPGLKIRLANGNVASRVLPIRIHDLDPEDTKQLETELKGHLRPIDFLFKTPGVNRPLRPDDSRAENDSKMVYRDQINKVGNAVRELVQGMRMPPGERPEGKREEGEPLSRRGNKRKKQVASGLMIVIFSTVFVFLAGQWIMKKSHGAGSIDQSIAVLPFKNLSGDPLQDYFSDGITEEIINSITQIKGLKVPGRSSSFSFKGKETDLKEVGSRLNVSTVLEGSVRRQGDRVRIDAQITSVKDGYQLWSQQFDRKLDNVFEIQEEIAQAITRRLKITLLQREEGDLGEGLTQNTAAHDAVLRARYFWNRRELKESEKYFQQAIDLDPNYASAYAGLAETYVISPFFHTGSPDEAMPKAEEAALKAIQLDSLLASPYLTLGFKNTVYDLNPAVASKNFVKGLRLNPNSPQGHYWYGQYLAGYESCEHSIAEMQRAVELEPLASTSYFNLSIAYNCAEKYKEALAAAQTSAELNKQNGYAYMWMMKAYLGLGQQEEARKICEAGAKLSNEFCTVVLIFLDVKDNRREEAVQLFDRVVALSQTTYVSEIALTMGAYYLDKKELAFEHFAKALNTHDIQLSGFLKRPNFPRCEKFLDEPKSKVLLERFYKQLTVSQKSP